MMTELKAWERKLREGLDVAHNFHFENKARLPKEVAALSFFGMGGSGIAGRIARQFVEKHFHGHCQVVNQPEVPITIDSGTLSIVVSYSGNTWETVAALETLAEKALPTLVIAHGGRAAEIAAERNIPFVLLPESSAPRAALGHFLGIILGLLDLMGVLPDGKKLVEELADHAAIHVPDFEGAGHFKEFLELAGDRETFHIWGVAGDSDAAAYRAQTQFNENAKVRAVHSSMPELCHNLLASFESTDDKPLVLMMHTDFLAAKLAVTVDVVGGIVTEQGGQLYKVPSLGDTWPRQLFYSLLWADFASLHLANQRKVEAAPVVLINTLKKRVGDRG